MAKIQTAYHEAGHVLMHILTEIELKEVSIVSAEDYNGITNYQDYGIVASYDTSMREDTIRCLVAGPIAEQQYCWLKWCPYDPAGEESDNNNLSRLFYECNHNYRSYEGYHRRVGQLKSEVRKEIQKHWPFIQNIAETLMIQERLTAAEITDLWAQYNNK